MQDVKALVLQLLQLKTEQSWVEFKHDNYKPDMIGEDISAIANAVALDRREYGYMIWGIHDVTHDIIGTDYDLQTLKKGNEEIENWLRHQLSGNADFVAYKIEIDGRSVVVIQISAAVRSPVLFNGVPYIRIGSITKKLQAYTAVEAKLWKVLGESAFELRAALADLTLSDVQSMLDVSAYFERCKIPQPVEFEKALHYLEQESVVRKQDNALYTITNLGALLFARRLSAFPSVASKFFRVVRHEGDSRLEMLQDRDFAKGYAYAFEEGLQFAMSIMQTREPIVGAVRKVWTAVPEKAMRETMANMLVHRDMADDSTDALVEVFDSRIEVTNPGILLVDPKRIVDNPPRARNPKLAELMRRMHFCEASGSGWDKIISSCEAEHLPVPHIHKYDNSVKVVLFAERPYGKISREEKLLAIYYHACVQYMISERLTNASLRRRFGLKDSDAANLSRIVKDAVEAGLIKPYDPLAGRKFMSYVPFWA